MKTHFVTKGHTFTGDIVSCREDRGRKANCGETDAYCADVFFRSHDVGSQNCKYAWEGSKQEGQEREGCHSKW